MHFSRDRVYRPGYPRTAPSWAFINKFENRISRSLSLALGRVDEDRRIRESSTVNDKRERKKKGDVERERKGEAVGYLRR